MVLPAIPMYLHNYFLLMCDTRAARSMSSSVAMRLAYLGLAVDQSSELLRLTLLYFSMILFAMPSDREIYNTIPAYPFVPVTYKRQGLWDAFDMFPSITSRDLT